MREIDDILDAYLARPGSADPVGSDAPLPSPKLEPLLRIAAELETIGRVEPSVAAVERVRAALLRPSHPRVVAGSHDSAVRGWRRPAFALAFAIGLLALGTTSVFASAGALPDSPLYALRNFRESLQVQLAGSPGPRAILYAGFAVERSTQLADLLRKNHSAPAAVVGSLLHDIADRVQHANQEARDDGQVARRSVTDADGQIGEQLTQLQQEGDFSGGEQDSLTDTLRAVQAGQSGPSGTTGASVPSVSSAPSGQSVPSGESGNVSGNDTVNQP